ncbi:PAS domain S-box protein [Denitratisoma oestradiolicum]|uniref:histidine kinase n=1 Tax=Denitratisoma oestradiolicum TaxID=311182 RepID=A0A6S6XUM7_9PROT|nr:PAS domain S-box protein [Denitratisoma oestradiolicum]TWO81358.1 hypothetical protein CBW56_04390 [Denitratisoma oestradiolicum]CAB1368550.1 putative two-component system sensor protein [Denitratisoma oestradiolicum]
MRPVEKTGATRILIVEDEGIVARDIERRLTQSGYGVCGIADNAEEAIGLARAEQPDLVLMDIIIQGPMDGIATAQEIRRHLDIPVVFLTAHSDEATVSRARETLPYGYLLKPFEPRGLVTTIETALYRHGAETRERMFRKVLDAVGVGIAILDATAPERSLLWVNPAFCQMFGYEEAELLGRPCPPLSNPEHRAIMERELSRALTEGRDGVTTLQVPRKDGSFFYDQIVISPVRDGAGRLERLIAMHHDVTAQHVHERELESRVRERTMELTRAQLRLEQAQEAGGVASWEYDVVTENFWASENYYDLTGTTRQEMRAIALAHRMRVVPEDQAAWSQWVSTLDAGKSASIEFRVREPDGEGQRWQVLQARSMFDENGNFVRVIGTLQDVTERKELELRLQQSLDTISAILEASPVGVAFFRDRKVQRCNSAFAAILGKSQAEVEGGNYEAFYHPRPSVTMAMIRADFEASPDHRVEYEIEIPRDDDSLSWVRTQVALIDKDEPASGTVVICEDITSRRHSEALRERLLAILENSPDIISMTYPDGRIDFINRAGREALGLGDDHRGRMLGPIYPDWALKLIVETGLPTADQDGIWSGETALHHVQGFDIPMHQVILSHRDAEGKVVRYSSVGRDLTEQKRAEADLIVAKEAAERASLAKSAFLSGMSHELRTPLNAILGFAQLLDQDPLEPLSPGQKESVGQITIAGWHLLKLINDVLDLSRIEAGKYEVSLQPIDVVEVVDEVLRMLAPQAETLGIRLENRLDGGKGFSVQADRTRFIQVLTNLLSNAIKYNHRGGMVTLSALREMSYVRLMVEDTGPGLSAVQQMALFQPFNRLGAEASGIEGTGIGLVICKRLMEAMNGRIGMISTSGTGSIFWVELPVAALPSVYGGGVPADVTEPVADLRQPLVLYVEDNTANRVLMERVLDKLSGIRLISAARGGEGLALARQYRPDLVLLDINLPDMSGLDVARALGADELTCDIPIVGLSANAMPHDIEAARAGGIKTYLTKPIDIRKLLQTVTRLLQARQKI